MTESRIVCVKGRAVPVSGDDIDTDRIMPARFLLRLSFERLGECCFYDEKDHPFNDATFGGARVMAVNSNFGCGSSREHAPQGIRRRGIRAIIGESFGDIFAGNCVAIGLVAVTASKSHVRKLMALVRKDPTVEVKVDLEKKRAFVGTYSFPVNLSESDRKDFLEGSWNSIATLLPGLDQVRRKAKDIPYLRWRNRQDLPAEKQVR
jgi:3-isopropylmalate/(R)-2-methylmalate dehydratase small subunit